ncbi:MULTISPECIES: hypothetical protein [Anaeromyxobacter]|uniref:hypothetical protein n=1 Tax=Anaeromyxobacter TaxID=161492 RepID=UPI001F58ABD5|nr:MULTISPECIES: hypothetical protein [unclassified Anaeromyxobacter]
MKLVLRAAAALAILGLATPAFPCGDKQMTTASSSTTASTKSKAAVAKADKKAAAKTAKAAPQKATATN